MKLEEILKSEQHNRWVKSAKFKSATYDSCPGKLSYLDIYSLLPD